MTEPRPDEALPPAEDPTRTLQTGPLAAQVSTREIPEAELPDRTVALPVMASPAEPTEALPVGTGEGGPEAAPADPDRTFAAPMVASAPERTVQAAVRPRRRWLPWAGLAAACLVLGAAGAVLLLRPDLLGLGQAAAPVPAPEEAVPQAPAEETPNVAREVPPALRPYLERAGRGDAKAMYLLAVFYTQGVNVPQDPSEGRRWLRKAAEAGHAGAQKELRSLEGVDRKSSPPVR